MSGDFNDLGKLELALNQRDRLTAAIKEACDLLAERKYGSNARSPGHNARLLLERALESALDT